jgi:uncharacterized protein (TIGR02996 family)
LSNASDSLTNADRLALFQTILDDPEQDAPRLILADWLEEHGEATHAELIRLQIERDDLLQRCPTHPALDDLNYRIDRIAHDVEMRVHRRLPRIAGVRWGHWEKGWPRLLQVAKLRIYLDHAAELHAAAPWDRLRIEDAPSLADLVELGSRVQAAVLLSTLIFRPNSMDHHRVRELARGTHFKRLRRLVLSGHHINRACVEMLTDSLNLSRLKVLDLTESRIGLGGMRALSGSNRLEGLTDLNLSGNFADLGDKGLEALARATSLPRLVRLSLARNQLGTDDLDILADSPRLERLEILDLSHNRLPGEALAALLYSPAVRNLRRLHLGGNAIHAAALREIADSPRLERLEILDLTPIAATPKLADMLTCSIIWPNLAQIVLRRPDDLTHHQIDQLHERFEGKLRLWTSRLPTRKTALETTWIDHEVSVW